MSNLTRVILTALLVWSGTAKAFAQYGPASANHPYSRQVTITVKPHVEYLHEQYYQLATAGCHPSRAALLAMTIHEAGPEGIKRPEVRAKVAALRRGLTYAERKQLQRLHLIEANYRKYLERQARNEARQALQAARRMQPIDRPRDPFLDQLAAERTERKRRAANADR